MSRLRYVAVRTVQTAFLLWLVLTFLFFFFRLMPGSFVDTMLYRGASPETIAAFKAKWGLDDPLYVQYYHYLVNLAHFDLGQSIQFRQPVWEFVRMKMFNTFILVAPAITFAYVLGAVGGTLAGYLRGTRFEKLTTSGAIFAGTIPEFFSSILLIVMFAIWFNVFPTSGMLSVETSQRFSETAAWWRPYFTVDFLSHYVLPFVAVVMRTLYIPLLVMRTSVVEVLGQDFIYYHRVSGVPRNRMLRHIGKHASLPVITQYPLSMTRAIGGIVLIETVFNWPGIGYALVRAVMSRDLPVVQFVFFVVAAFVILSNYVVDVAYGVIDPRISVDD